MIKIIRKIIKTGISIYAKCRLKNKALANGKRMALKEHSYIFSCNGLKAKFYLPLYKNEYIQQSIIANTNYYEYNNLNYIASIVMGGAVSKRIKDNVVLDIGANIGNHTLFFLLECGAGKVHCFEPMDKTFSLLKKNIELNGLLDKVVLNKMGVGAFSTKANLLHFKNNNMGSTELAYDQDGSIPVIAIDDILFDEIITFVKVDVEGFEYEVIKGMRKTVEKHLPYIMIELRSDFFHEVYQWLSTLGYWYIRLGNSMNYLFIPKDS